MGKGRASEGKDRAALIGLGAAALGFLFKKVSTDSTIHSLNNRIAANNDKRAELSKGMGWLTKRDKINELDEKNDKLRAKRDKAMK